MFQTCYRLAVLISRFNSVVGTRETVLPLYGAKKFQSSPCNNNRFSQISPTPEELDNSVIEPSGVREETVGVFSASPEKVKARECIFPLRELQKFAFNNIT